MLNLITNIILKYGLQSINLVLLIIVIWLIYRLLKKYTTGISDKVEKNEMSIRNIWKKVNESSEKIANIEGRLEK